MQEDQQACDLQGKLLSDHNRIEKTRVYHIEYTHCIIHVTYSLYLATLGSYFEIDKYIYIYLYIYVCVSLYPYI